MAYLVKISKLQQHPKSKIAGTSLFTVSVDSITVYGRKLVKLGY